MDKQPVGLDEALTDKDRRDLEAEEAARKEAERLDLTPLWHWVGEWNEGTWLTDRPPKRRNLLEWTGDHGEEPGTYLPQGFVAMLSAAGGMGKTQALVQLAVSVATGTPWLSPDIQVASPGHVLLALAEENADEVRRRLYYATRGLTDNQLELVRTRVLAMPLRGRDVSLQALPLGGGTLARTDFATRLRDHLVNAGVEWRLLVLDPASRFAGPGMETDNHLATKFVEALEDLTTVPGCPTCLVAHHWGKAALRNARESGDTDQTASRGSSAFTDGVRWQANLFTNDHAGELVTTLSIVKTNYGGRFHKVELVRDQDRFRALTQAEARTLEERKVKAAAVAKVEGSQARKDAEAEAKRELEARKGEPTCPKADL